MNFPAGELKHGALTPVDDAIPEIAVAPNNDLLEKLKSNLMEVRARGAELFAFAYHVAIFRGTDLDQPRNFAKSVTVDKPFPGLLAGT